jgi:hypothetical protein
MIVTENPPHVRRIDTDRPDAWAFEITGHISAADVENMYGLLEAAFELHESIDLLVRIDHYEGFDWSAAFRESTLVGKSRVLSRLRRYAVIGGPGWVSATMALVKPFMSVEMKHFEAEEEAHAWAWIDARPAEPD